MTGGLLRAQNDVVVIAGLRDVFSVFIHIRAAARVAHIALLV